jgi:hypothetical protein
MHAALCAGRKLIWRWPLQGTFTTNQRLLLGRLRVQMSGLEQQLTELTEIERRVACHEELIQQRLDTIPGIDRITAWTVLAEIGTDMSVFGDARHLASWAALCPGNRESGGKRISGKTRKGNRYLRRVLCQSAWAASHKKDSHLSALFRRIRSRRGEQKAIMALAHQRLTIIFHVVRDGSVYQELGAGHYDRQNKPKATRKLVERLPRLGYYVTLQPMEQPVEDAPAANVPDSAITEQVAPPRRRGRPCKCAERGISCKHARAEAAPLNSPEISRRAQPTANVNA